MDGPARRRLGRGLAPSAAAAAVLAEDLGIGCDNTAKWLYEHARGRAAFRPGQLLIVDEATLAGTRALDRLTALAHAAGAKVLLVGDWARLQSVDAGGAFALLVHARGDDVPELSEVHTASPTTGRSAPRWRCAEARSTSSAPTPPTTGCARAPPPR
ncbi:AAA family ATPase [Georgenia yuyongxinii]|uniref:AAA family ATPase n=1 Tax=Georgenia yuyongxinii TaxID=2589797 RepID=UPI001E557F0E|nr:AAA family ATPase [Georgenia yuyongxinii]